MATTWEGDPSKVEWYKFLGLALFKLIGTEELVVTSEDIAAIERAFPEGPTILAHDRADGLHLRVLSGAEGDRLKRTARKPF